MRRNTAESHSNSHNSDYVSLNFMICDGGLINPGILLLFLAASTV